MNDDAFWLEWLKEENQAERVKKIRTLWAFKNENGPFGIVTADAVNSWCEGLVKAICQKAITSKTE